MCQRVYMASRSPLPAIGRSCSAPYLTILALSKDALGVRRWFSRDAKHFAEAHGASPCGCGFPEISDYRPDRPVPHDDQETLKALATYLEQRPGRRYIAELLLCWVGDEDEKPLQSREIDLAALRASGFRFRRGEVLRIRAMELVFPTFSDPPGLT